MEKEFDILTGAKRLDEVRFSKIRTVMDMVADLRAKGEKVLALSAGEPDFDTPAPIKDKTKLLVMNNPNNPTGAVYSKECLEQVCELAKEKNFLILSDEMYSRLVYGDGKFYSIASFPDMKERTIIINGFSKTYAMTGWRVGYVAAPAKLLPSILKVHQYCSTCCPTFIHVGLANALDLPETEEAVCKMVDAFAKRREVLIEGLDQIPGITYVKPEGAF